MVNEKVEAGSLEDLKGFMYDENLNQSKFENKIITVEDARKFLVYILHNENNCKALDWTYNEWLDRMKDLEDLTFITMIYEEDNKWKGVVE